MRKALTWAGVAGLAGLVFVAGGGDDDDTDPGGGGRGGGGRGGGGGGRVDGGGAGGGACVDPVVGDPDVTSTWRSPIRPP